MEVQERIASYIADNGIKQAFIVEKTGYSKDIVSAILNSRRKMSADEYEKFCIALNREPNDFMCLKEN